MTHFPCRGLDGLRDVGQEMKETVDLATDAHTVSYDALASIQTRADEVNSDMKRARTLQVRKWLI